jgi:hypothetical protein
MAQGAINEIRSDPRFADFIVSVAKAPSSGEADDLTVFRIFRKPIRRVSRLRMFRFESVN